MHSSSIALRLRILEQQGQSSFNPRKHGNIHNFFDDLSKEHPLSSLLPDHPLVSALTCINKYLFNHIALTFTLFSHSIEINDLNDLFALGLNNGEALGPM